MRPPMPRVEGVQHARHDLPTGVRVHVATAGPQDAPVVVALHGWPQHWWTWREVIPRLAGEFRVVCPDLRGCGWSSAPADGDFTKERLADDVLALVDILELERVCLAGHDWGGSTAILAALRAPERFSALVAMSTGHPWVPRARAARSAWRLAYQLPLAAPLLPNRPLARAVLNTSRRGPGEVETYLDAISPQASTGLYRAFLVREVAPAAMRRAPERPSMPALLLHGGRDPLGTDFTHGFPGEVEIVPGAGHFLPEDRPELVADRIRAMCG